jgi:TolB-like protein/class 3 adenylate cyclase
VRAVSDPKRTFRWSYCAARRTLPPVSTSVQNSSGMGDRFLAAKQDQSPRVERRLAAIVAADVAGYSRLMGLDEVGTARALREHRKVTDDLVARHGGRLVKSTGDGVLLEFSSVVDAVECAVAVQATIAQRNEGVAVDRRMLFRIGINQGDILIDGDDILGDDVNIAARLESLATPGGLCISGSAYDQIVGKINLQFVDLGDQFLKNIIRPVRVYAVGSASTNGHAISSLSAARLSIVVLPFVNMSNNLEQDYFADGVTESLTTDLSRIAGAFVIARNTAFTYKGKAVDVRRVGRELNVRYVLEGSVQRTANRLRINVQLIDAETAKHLWAQRFDKTVADLFDMQDEIVASLANELNAELVAAEANRAKEAPNPTSMDLYFQGQHWFNKGLTPECMSQARTFFERAQTLDPKNVESLVGVGIVDLVVGSNFMSNDPPAAFVAAEANLTKALSMLPSHAIAHGSLGLLFICTNRAVRGLQECEQALALDRNLAKAHGVLGLAKYILGHSEQTEGHITEALRLSPRDNHAYMWMHFVGMAKAQLQLYQEAVVWFRRGLDINRNHALTNLHLSASLARLGKLEEARAAVQAGLALNPRFTVRAIRESGWSNVPAYVAGRERLVEGMVRAGAPDE